MSAEYDHGRNPIMTKKKGEDDENNGPPAYLIATLLIISLIALIAGMLINSSDSGAVQTSVQPSAHVSTLLTEL